MFAKILKYPRLKKETFRVALLLEFTNKDHVKVNLERESIKRPMLECMFLVPQEHLTECNIECYEGAGAMKDLKQAKQHNICGQQ